MFATRFYKLIVPIFLFLVNGWDGYAQETIPGLISSLEKAETVKAKVDICYFICKAYEAGLKVDSSLFFANKIKEISQEGNYETGLGIHYLATGGALRLRNKRKESEEYSKKAIDIFVKFKNSLYLGLAYQQLASVYQLEQNYKLSRKNY